MSEYKLYGYIRSWLQASLFLIKNSVEQIVW